jgi:hypothetical protein
VAKNTKTRRILKSVGHELKANPPKVLATTRRKKGAKAAERQRKAILLSKARKRGARIKRKG